MHGFSFSRDLVNLFLSLSLFNFVIVVQPCCFVLYFTMTAGRMDLILFMFIFK